MPEPGHIWVIDDDRSIRWVLERALKEAAFRVKSFENGAGVLDALADGPPDAIITDVRMPGIDGIELLGEIQARHPQLPVIVITAYSDLDSAVSAYQGGAFEYLPKPFDVDEAVELARRACLLGKGHVAEAGEPQSSAPEIIGDCAAMQEVFRAIGRLSRSRITVLITGESGTGKELVARALHRHSPRAQRDFVALNMAAIPGELLESELFGHEKGAFTGAQAQRRGRFEQADGGTLFLDEIGDMPSELQTRLLRVLSDGEFYRVGGYAPRKADARIIAATHQNLEEYVRAGRFREDLYHRLNVIRIHVPSLRDRPDDIPLLLKHYLDVAANELGVEPKRPLVTVNEYLSGLEWPGNVRQLENCCRWLTVMATGSEIHLEDLPPELRDDSPRKPAHDWRQGLATWAEQRLEETNNDGIGAQATAMVERILIEAAIRKTGGKRQDAARLLGWGRNTLTRKIKELRLYDDGED
ncbi:MAG: nitrogen regulation protein NR(I) [Gammaproteobacteria bacterium]